MTAPEPTCLLIADISGSTSHLAGVAPELADAAGGTLEPAVAG